MCVFVWSGGNLKAVLACWDVNSSQIDHVPELSVGVVPQEGQNRYDSIRMDHHLQLIIAGHLQTASASLLVTQFKIQVFNLHNKSLHRDSTDLDLLDVFGHHFRHVLPKCSQLVVSDGIFGPDSGCREGKHTSKSVSKWKQTELQSK